MCRNLSCPWVLALFSCCALNTSFGGGGGFRVTAPLRAEVIGADALSPSFSENPRRHLRLHDCIEVALRNNLGLAARRVNATSSLEDVRIARAAFDPAFAASGGRTEAAGLLGTPDTNLTLARTAITTRTITGATVELSANTVRSNDVQTIETKPGATTGTVVIETVPIFDSSAALTLRQPLLKGGGVHVNRIPIELSLIGVNQANLDLRRSVLDVLQATENAFWQLAFAVQEREVRGKTVALSQRLIEETSARVKVGLATNVDTLQAEAALASRREVLIISRQTIEDRTDALLFLLGKLGQEKITLDVPGKFPTVPAAPPIDGTRALELIRQLPEYALQRQAIKERKLLVDKARNNLLPAVDLTAGGGYVGEASRLGTSFDQAFRQNNASWQLLLEVRFPFGFREERASLAKSRYALEIENLRIREIEQQLQLQIREAARAVAAGRERTKATDVSLKLNEQEDEQVFAKFKEGLSTFRETLLVQNDLEEARLAALRAQLDSVLAAVRLARLDGSLLWRNYFEWQQ